MIFIQQPKVTLGWPTSTPGTCTREMGFADIINILFIYLYKYYYI